MSAPTPVHNYLTYGTVAGAPITGDCIAGTLSVKQTVTIGATAYHRAPPATYADPNPGAPVATSLTAYPQTIAPGSVVTLFSDEATALIAAGAAS
jgi:hypothetical protein